MKWFDAHFNSEIKFAKITISAQSEFSALYHSAGIACFTLNVAYCTKFIHKITSSRHEIDFVRLTGRVLLFELTYISCTLFLRFFCTNSGTYRNTLNSVDHGRCCMHHRSLYLLWSLYTIPAYCGFYVSFAFSNHFSVPSLPIVVAFQLHIREIRAH